MKGYQVQLRGMMVSVNCRTYSYQVTDSEGDTHQLTVDVSLELFTTSPLKFQDGPLISRELLLESLEGATPEVLARSELSVSEPDIRCYMERHYPPRARTWNHYRPAPSADE